MGVHQSLGSLRTGTTLSHYRLIAPLGDGATSVVYTAEDLSLGRVVALKLLPSPKVPDLGKIARFQHEARTASTLTHPNICAIYEIAEHEGRHFIAMEYLEGRPLSAVIGERPLDPYRLIELAIQIADGLEAAHAARIIHRDLKPANIYVTERDHVKLLDFGVSVLMPFGTGSQTPTSATWLSEPGGTLPYMSPEQTRGEQLDTRSDLFSFGTVLYEMATGARPFAGASSAALADAIRQEPPFPARDLNANVPDELHRIIEKALEKNRKLRYQTASDISADLRRLKRDLDSPPRRAPAAHLAHAGSSPVARTPGVTWRGRPWMLAPLVAAAAMAGIIAAFGLPSNGSANAPRPETADDPSATDTANAVTNGEPRLQPPSVPRPAVTQAAAPAALPATAAAGSPSSMPAGTGLPSEAPSATLDSATGAVNSRRAWAGQQLTIAQSKFDLRLYDQTIDTLSELIRTHGDTPAAPTAYLMKAAVLEQQDKPEDAMATYLEMAARYPEHPRAPEALVLMADRVRDSRRRDASTEARRLYTDVVTKFPASPWGARALLSRAELETRERLHQRDELLGTSVPAALVTYRDLVSRYAGSPQREHALWRLAEIYIDTKRFELAAGALSELGRRYPNTRYEAWFTAAEIYEKRLKDRDQARAAYARVPSSSPKYAEALKRLSRS